MANRKRVAIVGGGFSGCAMIKALKEDGMEPVCFEKTDQVGGTWCYRQEVQHGVASTTSTTIINHSKEMGATSDFPYPDDTPNYMTHRQVYEMFLRYAKNFDILRYVMCNKEVIHVRMSSDYEETGRWHVTVKDQLTDETKSEVFDAVMICTGHIAHPTMPDIPGIDDFQGRVLHSHSLKTFESFTGENVVVVGGGCSALDAAVDTSNVANKVYLSVRTPCWITPRLGSHGVPFDYLLLRRSWYWLRLMLTKNIMGRLTENLCLNEKFNHRLYGINPQYGFFNHDPVINDVLPIKLMSGTVVMKGKIKAIGKDNVVFEEGEESIKVDTIIMATGYKSDFSYLNDGILINDPPGKFHLYKCMYPAHLKHPTLAFIGFLLPLGPGFPIGELQIRWASFMLSTNSHLPNYKDMMKDIETRYRKNLENNAPSDKTSQQVDFIEYMDDIASQFGVKPNLCKMLFTDPKLYCACVFGPCVPYQYRLVGPHKWDGARNAVLTAHNRMKRPLRTTNQNQVFATAGKSHKSSYCMIISLLLILILISCGVFTLRYGILAITFPRLFVSKSLISLYILLLIMLSSLI